MLKSMATKRNDINIDGIEEAVKGITKKKRVREDRQLQVEDGDITNFLRQKMDIMSWEDIDTNNSGDVEDRLNKYIEDCMIRDVKPTVATMALSLGIDRKTLWAWNVGQIPKPKEVLDVIKKYYGLISGLYEDYMNNGKINPVSGIFLMKQIGYTDTQEIVVQAKDPLGELKSAEAIEQRYLEDVEN